MTDAINYISILMLANAVFYVAIILVAHTLIRRVNRFEKELKGWGEIEKLITVELRELIKKIKT